MKWLLIDAIGYSSTSIPRGSTNTIVVCKAVRNSRSATPANTAVTLSTHMPNGQVINSGSITITPIVPSVLGAVTRSISLEDSRANADATTLTIEITPLSNDLGYGDMLQLQLPANWILNADPNTPSVTGGGGTEAEEEDTSDAEPSTTTGAAGGGGVGGTSPGQATYVVPAGALPLPEAVEELEEQPEDLEQPDVCALPRAPRALALAAAALRPGTTARRDAVWVSSRASARQAMRARVSGSPSVHVVASEFDTVCAASQLDAVAAVTQAGAVDPLEPDDSDVHRRIQVTLQDQVFANGIPFVLTCTNVKPPGAETPERRDISITTLTAAGAVIDSTSRAVLHAVRSDITPAAEHALLQPVVVAGSTAPLDVATTDAIATTICSVYASVCRRASLKAQYVSTLDQALTLIFMVMPVQSVSVTQAAATAGGDTGALLARLRYTLSSSGLALDKPWAWQLQGACSNTQHDTSETDIDCGGPSCVQCGLGLQCLSDADCQSTRCRGLRCVEYNAAPATATVLWAGILAALSLLVLH